MDAKKILDKISESEAKARFTVSVDEVVLKEFKKVCGKRPVSPVIEAMMREFIASTKKQK